MKGSLCNGARTAPRLESLAEQRARAIDFARGAIWGEDAPERVRKAALRIVEVCLEDHGHDPTRAFPLTRERMGMPPKRSNCYRPRKGLLDALKQVRERVKSNVIDRFAKDKKVLRLRERLGCMSQSLVQQAQALLKMTVFDCQQPGRVEGRRKNLANVWMFGTELADILSKAHLKPKSESLRDHDRLRGVSDFIRRGLGKLSQGYFAFLVVDALRRKEEAKAKAEAARAEAARRQREAIILPPPQIDPAKAPEPSPGEKALAPKGYDPVEVEKALAEEDLERHAANRGAGIVFGSWIDDAARTARRR